MKVNFDYNYITKAGYFVILTSYRGEIFFGYVYDDNQRMIDQCNWNINGKEQRGRTQYDLEKKAEI